VVELSDGIGSGGGEWRGPATEGRAPKEGAAKDGMPRGSEGAERGTNQPKERKLEGPQGGDLQHAYLRLAS
jgi:hypothetical protein